jgi:Ser/Thr protein kinase RdoA (MazF antagonist)
MTNERHIPEEIRAAYHLSSAALITPITVGLINRTYLIEEREKQIIQRVNSIFGPRVHDDIEAITAHLEKRSMRTTRLIRNRENALYTIDNEGGVWRALTYLPGTTLQRASEPYTASAAGALVARFHRAVSDLSHEFQFSRPGAHDTPLHMKRLQEALAAHKNHPNFLLVDGPSREVLSLASSLPALPAEPLRIVHGDLKISNLLFSEDGAEALALLDLDTMARSTIPIELGDALRSWCNTGGEDLGAVHFDARLFAAALQGYASEAQGLLTPEERSALVLGAMTISLELAARFAADALNESYFGWDAARFSSRSEHNMVRARSQLLLAKSIHEQREELERIARDAFAA